MRSVLSFLLSIAVPLTALAATHQATGILEPTEGWGPRSALHAAPIEPFESSGSWTQIWAAPGAALSVSSVAGRSNQALRIEYSLPPGGEWAAISEPLSIPFDPSDLYRIGLWIRGTGAVVTVVFKIVDADGREFETTFENEAQNPDWHWREFDVREMRYRSEKTDNIPRPPFRLQFAIGRVVLRHGPGGTKGWVELDELQSIGLNPHLEMSINQIGFDPGARKRAVVRLVNATNEPTSDLEYEIVALPEGGTISTGRAERFKATEPWPGVYWTIDMDSLSKTGRYAVRATIPFEPEALTVQSYPFSVEPEALSRMLSASQFHYIRYTRYPTNAPHIDPVPGGYIDTEYDIEKWMTTTPVWLWGMARWQRLIGDRLSPTNYDPIDEIAFCADFCIRMQDVLTGDVYPAVKSTRMNGWESDVTPAEDTNDVVVWKNGGPDVLTAYAAGMAEAALALREKRPELSAASLSAAVLAWQPLAGANLTETPWIGMYIWATMRLYEATGDPRYVDAAKRIAVKLLPQQQLDYRGNQEEVFGRFYRTPDKKLVDEPYKFVHAIGMYLGLIDLAEALKENDPLRAEIVSRLDCFAGGYLRKTCALNAYGVVAETMLPDGRGRWRLQYFHPVHGLNCDILSMGLIALRYAQLTGHAEYADIAADQLDWVVGRNPIGFCMVDGEGTTHPHVFATSWNHGPIWGGLPNGYTGSSHRPEWMGHWNSGEYWKPHNGMMLALLAEADANRSLKRDTKPLGSDDEVKAVADRLVATARELPSANAGFVKERWTLDQSQGSKATLTFVDGPRGQAARMDYSGAEKDWAQITMPAEKWMGPSNVFIVSIQSSQDSNAVLEVKLTDADGSTFWLRRPLSGISDGWTDLRLNTADFAHAWGGDARLDRIVSLAFAVALDRPSSGHIAIADVRP